MKHRLQTLLKHKIQWLVLLTALLGVSQGVWGNTPITIYMHDDSNWSTHKIYCWGGECSSCPGWPGTDMTAVLGQSGWYKIDLGFTPGEIIFNNGNGTQTGDITLNSNQPCYSNKESSGTYQTTCPSSCTPPTAGTATVQNSGGSWVSSIDIYASSTVDLKVTGYTGGSSIQWQYSTDNSSWNDCAGETSSTASISGVNSTTYYRAQITNDGCSATTSAVTVTRKYRIRVKKDGILESSANIYTWDGCNTITGNSNSWPGVAMTADGDWWYADFNCNPVSFIFNNGDDGNANQTVNIDASSRSYDCYELTTQVSGGGDDKKWNCSNIQCCTTPTASGFTMSPTSVTYDGSPHAVTVTPKDGYGAVSDIKYSNSSTIPTAVGDYTVTADIAAEGDWCAVNDLEIGTFSITKHNQATLSITTSTDNRCTGVLPLQLAVSGGSTSGTVTYAETTHTGTVSVSSSGEITASTDASITVTATMAGDATYDDVVSDPVTFTFTESPVIYLTGTGANGASATYPWEYMTITVDRGTGKTSPSDLDVTFTEEPSFSSGTAPAHSVTITGTEGDKTYKLKSAKTVNDAHYYSVKANGSNSGCAAAEAEYNVYINAAPAEVCN